MATFKDIVKQVLLKHCLEVTEKVRLKDDKKPKGKLSREQVREVKASLTSAGLNAGVVGHLMKAISVATERPEMMEPTEVRVPDSAIIVLEAEKSGHAFDVGKPYIATCDNEGANGFLLHEDGKPAVWIYSQNDNPRFATEEECKECIDSLNEEQMKTIMTIDLFRPVVLEAMNRQISISEEPDSTETEMPDGRTLMV